MHNWCFNTINVSGPKIEVKKFLKVISSSKDNPQFDFNTIITIPEEIKNTQSPNPDRDLVKKLLIKYGSEDWFDWVLKNWGTKWNPQVHDEWVLTETAEGKLLDINISIDTAWSPPTEFFINVSKIYPALTFENEFYEEGNCFIGRHVIKNGEFLTRDEPDWDSKAGIAMREDFGIYREEEEE